MILSFLPRPEKSLSAKRKFLQQLAGKQPPFRSELLDTGQVAALCAELAAQHRLKTGPDRVDLLKELTGSERVLWKVREILTESAGRNGRLSQKREFIPDNFYVILDQVQKTRNLLRQSDRDLPCLENGSFPGFPRIYEIAVAVISYTDSQIESASLSAIIGAYQNTTRLLTGELMAIKVMLKLALIGNLQRLAIRIPLTREGEKQQMWGRQEAEDRISLRNCISSLRHLDTINWQQFIDTLSEIDHMLCKDHSALYPKMDFFSRERYRLEVGKLAKRAGVEEIEVAHWAVILSKFAAPAVRLHEAADHVGYFLVGEGRGIMERSLGIRQRGRKLFNQPGGRFPVPAYLGGIVSLTLLVAGGFSVGADTGRENIGLLITGGILLVLCATELAKLVLDALVSFFSVATPLPRLDFSKEIPPEFSTLVVVPALLTSETEIEELVHMLEVRHIANKDENLHFGLLTDFPDARQETLPEDDRLLRTAGQLIEALNVKYNDAGNGRFFHFHRPRVWNPGAESWMGYERKRGKLMDLNALLRGSGEENFSYIAGDRTKLPGIKYVITLDSDTLLPRDTAWKMIATMAHPLNRARYDEGKRRVVAGYGMLQPRIRTDLRETGCSLYQQMYGHGPDVDPYTFAAPDVYQDLFGEGSFVGKGIYEVDIMLRTLHEQFPENRILSHDLLEGCHARAGLLNDLKLYERSFDYWVDVRRRHRWIRGDWQIAAWIGPIVPGPQTWRRNPLSTLSRWKILDNLRISLLPASLLLGLVLGWTVLPHSGRWTFLVLLVLLSPALTIIAGKMVERPGGILSWNQWSFAFREAAPRFKQCIYSFICLPYETFFTLHAILQASLRMLVFRKKLLEWIPSGSRESKRYYLLSGVYLKMWASPMLSVLLCFCFLIVRPAALIWTSPVLCLWIISPLLAWWLNRPREHVNAGVEPAQELFLRKQARKAWAYFDQFAGKEGNWLPPDHYQEYPVAKVAEYTSPTNMGLALLANIPAAGFGYQTNGRLIERVARTMHAMDRLERYKGHFYNWYHIGTLQPSLPRYVSTVDSGNLAGHLYILRQALLAIPGQPIMDGQLFRGLLDTLELLKEDAGPPPMGELSSLRERVKTYLLSLIGSPDLSPDEAQSAINKLTIYISEMAEMISGLGKEAPGESIYWIQAIEGQLRDMAEELSGLAPWLSLPEAPGKYKYLLPVHMPALNELSTMESLLPLGADAAETTGDTPEEREWLAGLRRSVAASGRAAQKRLDEIAVLVRQCTDFTDIEFSFLYNDQEQLLSIGYQVDAGRQDTDCYDVLASEARLATYVGICQGKLPVKSWFSLGRPVAGAGSSFVLLSANGTLFEYLMPLLVMPTFGKTLLDHGCKASVWQQIAYGTDNGIPWGVSESGYSTMDTNLNYQYKVFGIPALSLKHAFSEEDKVVAPYASMLALMVAPDEACRNLEQLSAQGMEARYGFFEAIDYTPSRTPGRHSPVIVRSFMAHHQGMSLLSLACLLLDKPLQKLFLTDPEMESSLELLQEKIPEDKILHPHSGRKKRYAPGNTNGLPDDNGEKMSLYTPGNEYPPVQLLSNGRYHIMMTATGIGYSKWKGTAVTPWSGNNERGVFCFIHDPEQGTTHSITFDPAHKDYGSYKTEFITGHTAFRFEGDDLQTDTRVFVSPEEDIEIRQVSIHNSTSEYRTLEITSFVHAALTPLLQNGQVPPFRTSLCPAEIVRDRHAVLYSRQTAHPEAPWLFHTMRTQAENMLSTVYEEVDSGLFPALSPAPVAIRRRIIVGPHGTVVVDIFLGIGENRQSCENLLLKCQDQGLASRLFDKARAHHGGILKQVNADQEDLRLFRRFAGSVLFSNNSGGRPPECLELSFLQPTVLLRISQTAHMELVAQIIQMHAYWRLMGQAATLVIWNEDRSCYRYFLQRLIIELITGGIGAEVLNRHGGGIFVKPIDIMSEEDHALLYSATEVIIAEEWDSSLLERKWRPIYEKAAFTA